LRGPLAADPTAQVLHALVLGLAIWFAGWNIATLPLYPDSVARFRLRLIIVSELVPAATLILLRLGYLRQAAFIFLTGQWVQATYNIARSGSIQATSTAYYITLPILATWLLGFREAFWTAGVCLASAFIVALRSGNNSFIPNPSLSPPSITMAGLVQLTLTAAVPIAHVLRTLREALAQSRRDQEMNRALAGRLITSQEDERARIGRDLHDGVCQDLAAVAIDLSCLRQKSVDLRDDIREKLREVQRHVERIADGIQALSHDLHPYVLQRLGLEEALRAHCAEVGHREFHVTFHAEGVNGALSRLVELSVFRITQEALRNAARHGHARRATVLLVRNRENLTLTVADEGNGFDVSAVYNHGGLGLVSMEERACLVQGRFSVASQPGEGTTIEVRVPVDIADDVDSGK
jgi:signal transduction histidine kinase